MKKVVPSLVIPLYCHPCSGFELIVLGVFHLGYGKECFRKSRAITSDAIGYTENNLDNSTEIVMTIDDVQSGNNDDVREYWREAYGVDITVCSHNHW